MGMTTTLYLARHGETEDNVRQIMQGQTQGRLTDNGRRQAEALAATLAHADIELIIASDLQRAVDTATIVAERLHAPLITTPLLRERDWGSFTGRHIPSLKGEPWPDDIETLAQLLARAKEFLDFARKQCGGKTALAVGHGIINKAIQAVHFAKPMPDITRMENGEARRLQL